MVVLCRGLSVPGLQGVQGENVRICYPAKQYGKNRTYPLLLFAHGDWAGGFFFNMLYAPLQEQLAGSGFVVPAYLTCWVDGECADGRESFLEGLKTIEHLEQHQQAHIPIDFSLPYTVCGHSTGGRVALMLAALRDTPAYLSNTGLAAKITTPMRAILGKIGSVIAYHPDGLEDDNAYPDVEHFQISKTPVMIITGTADTVEEEGSAWTDFSKINTPDKVFFNTHGAPHFSTDFAYNEAIFMSYFAQNWSLGNSTAGNEVCGNTSGSLQRTITLAMLGESNNGGDEGEVAFLCCNKTGAVPRRYAKYCMEQS